jgi:hypothetical protein
MADTTLHLSPFDLPPRRTVSIASMQIHPTAAAGFFEPWAGPAFAAEDIAECPHDDTDEIHDTPGADCTCGFRAADDTQTLLDLINPPIESLAGAAMLDVELGGIVLPMGPGFRGSSQRVLGASVLRWCGPCLGADQTPSTPPDLHALSKDGWLHMVGRCEQHAPPSSIALNPDDIADHLQVPVGWADRTLDARLRTYLERRWAAPQLIGPLEAQRRVAALRMGHLGFVAHTALRLDDRGRLWIDRAAPAAQRPVGASFIPVRRKVDLGLELIASVPSVARLDRMLARPRPRLLTVREEPIASIRGLRHLPRLAAAVQR